MSKLYFPKVKHYEVHKNLIFITWPNHFQCFDYITGESQFKIDHGLDTMRIINNKLFGQKENGDNILVYDLKGKLIQTINGSFYLWRVIKDGQFLFVPGADEKKERLGFKIDLSTLTIAEKLRNYRDPRFIQDGLGFYWLGNTEYCFNIYTGDILWTYDLGEGNYPEPDNWNYLYNENIILTIKDGNLISLNKKSGKCVWQKKTNLSFYNMHPVNKNLYGFGSSLILEVIDSNTGNLILSKEFPEMKDRLTRFVAADCQMRDDGLYFVQHSGDRKFGKIKIPNNEIEYIVDLDIPKEPGLRWPSFPYNNCFFAFDYNLNLQVIRPFIK